jgi:hypothetical protein
VPFALSIYRLLVRAYPSRFSDQYAEEMVSLFCDQLRDAESEGRVARLWIRTMKDWLWTVPVEYVTEFGHRWSLRRLAGPSNVVSCQAAVRRALVFAPNIPIALLLLTCILSYRVVRRFKS